MKRSLRRRLLFSAILVAMAVLFLEGASFLIYRSAIGEWFSYSAAASRQAEVVALSSEADERDFEAMTPEQRGAAMNAMCRTAHPYLGYVYTPDMNEGGFADFYAKEHAGLGVTRFGFVDASDPIRKRGPDRLVVGIVGGSVALGFGAHGTEALTKELQKHPALRGRNVDYVRLALGGYKQPQQLLAIAYLLSLGAEFDYVINIDGFNEIALPPLENVKAGVFPYFPRAWQFIAGGALTREQRILVGRRAAKTDDRRVLAQTFQRSALSWSVTLQLVWALRDRALASSLGALDTSLRASSAADRFVATGPGTQKPAGLHARLAEHWRRSSAQLARLCAENGIRYLHFLQPNQYVPKSKVLSDVERQRAFDDGGDYMTQVLAGYPRLIAEGRRLRAEGVDFHDLTQVFRGRKEDLYIDACCHFNTRGQEIMAEAIGRAVRANRDVEDGAGAFEMPRAVSVGGGRAGSSGQTPQLRLVRGLGGVRLLLTGCAPAASGSLVVAPGLAKSAAANTGMLAPEAATRIPFVCAGDAQLPASGWVALEVPANSAATVFVQAVLTGAGGDFAQSNALRVEPLGR